MTTAEQRNEAVLRIQELIKRFDLHSDMLDFFQNGSIYGLDYVEESDIEDRNQLIAQILATCQHQHHTVVYYYFVVDVTIQGYHLELLHLFYVGQHESDWQFERLSDTNDMYIRTYELHNPDDAEMGFIKVGAVDGNLIRYA